LNKEAIESMMTHLLAEYRRKPMSIVAPLMSLRAPSLTAIPVSERIFHAVLTLELWMERWSQRRALRELPEYAARDLALSRADIEAEASKPFWKA
jgi:uncharacterized protein YjiS (DUF1127 family)